jgi:hypothetical protein
MILYIDGVYVSTFLAPKVPIRIHGTCAYGCETYLKGLAFKRVKWTIRPSGNVLDRTKRSGLLC